MSAVPRLSCALSIALAKNGQPAYIACSRCNPPRSISACSALPSPNQPGRLTRAWVHEKTHGIARRSSSAGQLPEPAAADRPRSQIERRQLRKRRRGVEKRHEVRVVFDQRLVRRRTTRCASRSITSTQSDGGSERRCCAAMTAAAHGPPAPGAARRSANCRTERRSPRLAR